MTKDSVNLSTKVSNITNNLQTLIPFGTLFLYKLPPLSFQGTKASDGWKWFDPPLFSDEFRVDGEHCTISSLIEDLTYLSIRGYVKITFKPFKVKLGPFDQLCLVLRIYLVPFDIHGSSWMNQWRERVSFKKSANWNEKRYKIILQNLISVLDFSSESWYFKCSVAKPLKVLKSIILLPFSKIYENFDINSIGTSVYGLDNNHSIKQSLNRLSHNKPFVSVHDETEPEQITKLMNIYNDIKSPKLSHVEGDLNDDRYKSISNVLNNDIAGMRSDLYKYQTISVAKMLEKEFFPTRSLAPNMIEVTSPTLQKKYYLDILTYHSFRDPESFAMPRGGILAENMGLGKTCICLALICASIQQNSEIPEELAIQENKDDKVQSLVQYCTREIQRNLISWRPFRDHLPETTITILENTPGFFYLREKEDINIRKSVRLGLSQSPPLQKHLLCNTTLIVCPDNLFYQWSKEIDKHIEPGFVKVLDVPNISYEVPTAIEMIKFDIVLMSISSFGKHAELPDSSLKQIYWKRFIIDEGHSMNSKSTRSAYLAKELLVERRWSVTGTPTAGLTRLHVNESNENSQENDFEKDSQTNQYIIKNKFNEKDDLQKLGVIISNFLQIEPFHSSPKLWASNISKPFLDGSYGSDTQLHNLLSSLIVRHSLDDIESDIKLPPLHHKAVFLKPSFHNKLALNLFIAVLAANAVSSERNDIDYMFHPANRSQLRRLVSNLQRATFYWSGFSQQDVESLVSICESALKKTNDIGEPYHNVKDIQLLEKSIIAAKTALSNTQWRTVAFLHEMAYYISNLPHCFTRSLGIGVLSDEISVFGAPQITAAQKFFYKNRFLKDSVSLISKLDSYSKPFWQKYWSDSEKRNTEKFKVQDGQVIDSELIEDAINEPDSVRLFRSNRSTSHKSPPVTPTKKKNGTRQRNKDNVIAQDELSRTDGGLIVTDISVNMSENIESTKFAKVLGTASAKLSYLGSRLLEHQFQGIKSIIFFEFEDSAYYLTELLDILGITYIMYATFIKPHKRAQNISEFTSMDEGVSLIMDLKLASHGLTITSATRVYFINPVWRRSVEAQAIKRAHRIGQHNDVFVETLILEGTLEEEMYKKRSRDNEEEKQGIEAKNLSVIDDSGMQDFVLKHEFLDFEKDKSDFSCFASSAISQEYVLGETVPDEYTLLSHVGKLNSRNGDVRKWDIPLFNSLNLDKLNEQTGKPKDDILVSFKSAPRLINENTTGAVPQKKDRIRLANELKNIRTTKKVKFA